VFGDAVTGRDGEIVFGENDNGGHVCGISRRSSGVENAT